MPYICEELRGNSFIHNHLILQIMNKTELVEKIAAGANLSKADAKKALDATVAALKDALVAGDKIQLVGFGTFSVNERPAREGINPATKQKIAIGPAIAKDIEATPWGSPFLWGEGREGGGRPAGKVSSAGLAPPCPTAQNLNEMVPKGMQRS